MSPRTRLIPVASLATGVLIVAAACGEPPQPLPTSPPYASPSGVAGSAGVQPPGFPTLTTTPPLFPTAALPTGAVPPYPTYPAQTTTPPTTNSPTPTPSHAAKCSGEPTGAQILALIKGKPGIPTATLKVDSGPYCSGGWSFTTVEIAGKSEDQLEPLMVVTVGKGSTLGLVAAGSDVCNGPVQTDAPPGIRVLACGF